MLKKFLLILSVLFVAILIGCNKTETSNTTAENSNKAATMTNSKTTTTASTGEKIGVPECDDYIAKYEACTPKVPEPARAAYKSALDQARANWKKLAANPTTKASLTAACKKAMEMQESNWKTYGCAQ